MLSEERYEVIINMLKTQNFVKVSDLTEAFGVSVETVRRDLFFLESRSLLKRVHGGATCSDTAREFLDLSHRMNFQTEKKKRLAITAVSLIKENDIIAIDCGSTAVEFAEAIKNRFQSLTIVTNSVAVLRILRQMPNYNLILTGGQYHKSEDAFFGPLAENQLKSLSVCKSFVFPSGVSLKHGVTDYLIEFVPLQKAYIEIAEQCIIMADSSKFEFSALTKLCDVSSSHIYITDDDLSDEIYDKYLSHSVNIFRGEKIDHA